MIKTFTAEEKWEGLNKVITKEVRGFAEYIMILLVNSTEMWVNGSFFNPEGEMSSLIHVELKIVPLENIGSAAFPYRRLTDKELIQIPAIELMVTPWNSCIVLH